MNFASLISILKPICAAGLAKPLHMKTNEPLRSTPKQIYIQRLSPFLLTHWCVTIIAIPPGSSQALCCVKNGKCCHQRLLEDTRERERGGRKDK